MVASQIRSLDLALLINVQLLLKKSRSFCSVLIIIIIIFSF